MNYKLTGLGAIGSGQGTLQVQRKVRVRGPLYRKRGLEDALSWLQGVGRCPGMRLLS